MKEFFCITAICLTLFIAFPSIQSQAQESAEYTFLRGSMGPQVCVGRYIPPTGDTISGVCEGQVLDVVQFNAVSAKLSADRLDQTIHILEAIDNKLALNNDRMEQLIKTAASAQASANKQDRVLSETIERRFDTMPEELLANDLFKQELAKLKADILKEVEKSYQPRQAPAAK